MGEQKPRERISATRNTALADNGESVPESKKNIKFNEGESDEFEFGGSLGSAALMIGFPLLMWFVLSLHSPSHPSMKTNTRYH